jgi:WD40 repeat protein
MELMDTPRDVLMEKVQYLDNLRKLAGQLETSSPEDQQTQILLMEKIGRDMDLYQHFSKQENRNLAELMQFDPAVEDEHVGLIGSDVLASSLSIDRDASRRGSIEVTGLRHTVSKQSLRTVQSVAALFDQDGALSSVPPSPSGVFKWTLFRLVTIALSRPEFEKYRQPTCFSISSGLLVGTLSSVVLVFDLSQKLRGVLGDVQQSSLYGAVTCLQISPDHSQAVVGYRKGFVCLWDLKKLTLLKQVIPSPNPVEIDGHRSSFPITSVCIPSKDVFFSADEDGAAFYHALLNRIIYYDVRTTRIHGKVKPNEPPVVSNTRILSLSSPPIEKVRYPGDSNVLVAVASPYKLAILSMKPIPQILFRIPWSQLQENNVEVSTVDSSHTCWFVPTKHSKADYVLLGFSFGSKAGVLKITWRTDVGSKKKLKFEVVGRGQCNAGITSLHWMTSHFLVATTRDGFFDAFETSGVNLVERVRIEPRTIASDSSWRTTSLPTYHHNICSYRNRLFLLSNNELWFASLLTWNDRLGVLVRAGNFERAFQIGVELYHGNITVVVLGVPSNDLDRKSLIADHMCGLLINLTSMTLSGYDRSESDLGQYRYICDLVMKTSIALGQHSLLLGEIWDRFHEAELTQVYLDCLEQYVLDGKINEIPNPVIMKYMFEHFEQSVMEQLVLQLDPFSVDIHNSLQLCRDKGMMKAIIWIYNSALSDFLSPIVELLGRITLDKGAAAMQEDAYMLYVYIAYVLQGKAFPVGDLSKEQAFSACQSVYTVLCASSHQFVSTLAPGVSKDTLFEIGTPPWPYLRYLLALDTRELVKVLGAAFQNELLDTGIPLLDSIGADPLLVTRQHIIGILFRILETGDWAPHQVDIVHSLVGRSFLHYRPYVTLTKIQLMNLFNSLLDSQLPETSHDREIALLCLYKGGFTPFRADSDKDGYLDRFKSCGFWRVYEYHVLKEKRYDLAIESYLYDELRQIDAVSAVNSWLSDPELTESDGELIRTHFLAHVAEIMVDASTMSRFVQEKMKGDHLEVIKRLKKVPEKKLAYLVAILHMPAENKYSPVYGTDLYHQLMDLKCRLDPFSVRSFLEYCESNLTTLPFNADYALNLCRQYRVTDALIWILVRKQSFEEALHVITDAMFSCASTDCAAEIEKTMRQLLEDAFDVCRKGLNEKYWIDLLHSIFALPVHNSFLMQLQIEAIERISKSIPVTDIIVHLLQTRKDHNFGESRNLLLNLMQIFAHSKTSVEFASKLTSKHVYFQFQKLSEIARSSFNTPLGQCQICRRLLHVRAMTAEQQRESLIIFKCRHAFHLECLKETLIKIHNRIGMPGSVDDYEFWCVVCGNPSKRQKKGKNAQLLMSMVTSC